MSVDMRPIIGVTDAFGERAKALRLLQRRLLDLFAEAGFEEVIPPLVERPATLNSGAGMYLGDEMIVFSDPAGAGTLAIRPDMTPQIARIAATRLMHEQVLRLCYSGMVMTARPDSSTGARQQWQTGLELMGGAGIEEGGIGANPEGPLGLGVALPDFGAVAPGGRDLLVGSVPAGHGLVLAHPGSPHCHPASRSTLSCAGPCSASHVF